MTIPVSSHGIGAGNGGGARSTPKASVIVINHNYGAYLREAVQSALGQTLDGVEVVVVDDGSTDGSLDRISDLAATVTCVRKENGGQTSAMNVGFKASHGDVVVFLDADDRLLPHAVADAVAAFAQDDSVVKVHWPLAVVDRDGRVTGKVRPESLLAQGDLVAQLLTAGPDACQSPPQSGNAYARSFLDMVMPLPELELEVGRGSASADALLSLLAPAAGRVVAFYNPASEYRIHGENDYAGMDIVAKARRHDVIESRHFAIVEEFWISRGITVDKERWRASSWFCRLKAAFDEIEQHVPPGGMMILVDDDQWKPQFENRMTVPFLERGGQYWGPPADDDTAVAELERVRAGGATHLVVAWHCFWWLDAYPGLARHLAARYPVLSRSDRVVIHGLAGEPVVDTGYRVAGGRESCTASHRPAATPLPFSSSSTAARPAASGVEQPERLVDQLSSEFLGQVRSLIAAGSRCALVDFPDHANVGDSAIWLGERVALREIGVDVGYVCSMRDYRPRELAGCIGDGPILIHGGGNFGDLWPRHQAFREEIVERFPRNRIVQLPQTINFRSREAAEKARAVLNEHPDLVLLVRDRGSSRLARQLFSSDVRLTPDAALALGSLRPPGEPVVPVRWLARSDSESATHGAPSPPVQPFDWLQDFAADDGDAGAWPVDPGETSPWTPYDEAARRRVLRGCRLLAEGRVVVTDRLHGHVLSLLMGLPHVLLDDAHGKVRAFHRAWTSTSAITHIVYSPEEAWAVARLLADGGGTFRSAVGRRPGVT